jgi:hypothetical protein
MQDVSSLLLSHAKAGLTRNAVLQQDDLAVMVEDANGEYRFQAGSICTAGEFLHSQHREALWH